MCDVITHTAIIVNVHLNVFFSFMHTRICKIIKKSVIACKSYIQSSPSSIRKPFRRSLIRVNTKKMEKNTLRAHVSSVFKWFDRPLMSSFVSWNFFLGLWFYQIKYVLALSSFRLIFPVCWMSIIKDKKKLVILLFYDYRSRM
jgi:hypothetical protein